jgi:hypothetical protein
MAMALNWNIENVRDRHELHGKPDEDATPEQVLAWEVTNTLIWRCMAVGIREVTRENVAEFYARSTIWVLINGWDPDLTLEQIERRVGLTTNVSNETRAVWRKRSVDFTMDQIVDRATGDLIKLRADA